MPYSAEHKARTRARIVDCARRMFNRRGFEAVSIEAIMSAAGLTRGGFYNHFGSKEELYREAVASYAHCNPAENWDGVELDFNGPVRRIATQMIGAYLSREHLDDIDSHCPMIALPSDVARSNPAVRQAYAGLLINMVAVFEAAADPSDPQRRRKALAMATLCVGGMVLARTLDDPDLGDEIRNAAAQTAIALSDLDRHAA